MIQPWVTVLVAIVYISLLFLVASYGDRSRASAKKSRPNIYALSLAVYCTTWTFFGSVGLAATSGLSFLAIYVGPVLVVTLGFPLLRRIVHLSKEERITTAADFLGSRYGKNNKVAAVAAIIAVIGTIPYIALQLKAISSSVDTLLIDVQNGFPSGNPHFGDITIFVTAVLALFAVLFGTRHADATEHQHGLMLAIAMESVIKLIAFLCVGIFVTWFMFDGIGDLYQQASQHPRIEAVLKTGFDVENFVILTLLSLTVFILLPRQFHVAVVENNSDQELARARWLFPLYLVAINLFVIPIAAAGMLRFGIAANADDYVLLLPLLEGQTGMGLLVFLGGLSAGTAMVIVASVALSIMISNDIVLPLILRSQARLGHAGLGNMERRILNIRRTAIIVVLGLAFVYYSVADNSAALASIGLVSFAAIAQLAPAFFMGLFWKTANARGAMLGMICGFGVWGYCLLLPTVLSDSSSFVTQGLFGTMLLKPQDLFGLGLDPLVNGVLWSLAINMSVVAIGSLSRKSNPQERQQASLFVEYQTSATNPSGSRRSNIRFQQLLDTTSRYLGAERASRSFNAYWNKRGLAPDPQALVDEGMLRFSEQLLASAIGTSSARLVHSILIKRNFETDFTNMELLDEASRALQFNRDVLQTAIDQLEQGITVFDSDFLLASWNRQFRTILNLPDHMGRAGVPLIRIAEEIIKRNRLEQDSFSADELTGFLVNRQQSWQLFLPSSKTFLEISTSPMPEGGIVITWHDITERVRGAEALQEANETLEKRVEERTVELEKARQAAVRANASKTRFLAAAGHDVLQPLNAARLYSATLIERADRTNEAALAENISRALGSVEEILGSILAISRLDTETPEINAHDFPIRKITEQLEIEFEPIAEKAGLDLRFVHSSQWVHSDPAMLRRLLQNLISNALKFTVEGKVLVGCKRYGDEITLEVLDTGIGMNADDQKIIFSEFTRLNALADKAPGLGLGLSIVERIADLLEHKVTLSSRPEHGSRFRIHLRPVTAGATELRPYLSPKRGLSDQLVGTYVMCIDNEPDILAGMKALLEQWGCKVICARNLEEANAALDDAAPLPDIFVVDYHLEQTTGIEVFETLQKDAGAEITGVLLTADRTDQVKQQADQCGMGLLNKPVKPAALRAFISQHRIRQQAAE